MTSDNLSVPTYKGPDLGVGHGDNCIVLWSRAGVRSGYVLTPDAARRLAAILVEQAEASEHPYREEGDAADLPKEAS